MENASFLRRLGAMLYDSLLVFAVLFMGTVPFVAIHGGEYVDQSSDLVYELTMLLLIYAFFVYFWSRDGQTLGIRAWRMRLETFDGKVPSFGTASLRFVLAVVSLLPAALGFFWQLWDRDNLAWHDRWSGTRLRHYPRR